MVNFISWPLMFLSEVWFSLEGAPDWVRIFAKIFPLTHILSAARKVMCDGAGLVDVHVELFTLAGMTALPGHRRVPVFVEQIIRLRRYSAAPLFGYAVIRLRLLFGFAC